MTSRSGAREWHLLLYNIQKDMLNGSVKNPLTVKKNGQKTVFVVFATASFYGPFIPNQLT